MESEPRLRSLGLIMDGNRRWAREQGKKTYFGHKKGFEVFTDSIEWIRDLGIEHAVFYAFSTENWNRSEEEVEYLMNLFRDAMVRLEKRIDENSKDDNKDKPINIRVVGRKKDFPEDLQEKMISLEKKNDDYPNPATTIWVALSYGGRAEIVEAVNKAVVKGDEVTEETFEELLWTAGMPDPDMIVRTSGEHRLSNFMTWKSVYSEFLFLEKHWPAFTKSDLEGIVNEYGNRERRKGK